MPKTKFQNVIFTLMMAFLMVYAMICYNIFPEHRWNEQPGISHGFRRNEDYVAGCICTGVLYC